MTELTDVLRKLDLDEPEWAAQRIERVETVKRVLTLLPPIERKIVELMFYFDYPVTGADSERTIADVADMLDIDHTLARRWYGQALARLSALDDLRSIR